MNNIFNINIYNNIISSAIEYLGNYNVITNKYTLIDAPVLKLVGCKGIDIYGNIISSNSIGIIFDGRIKECNNNRFSNNSINMSDLLKPSNKEQIFFLGKATNNHVISNKLLCNYERNNIVYMKQIEIINNKIHKKYILCVCKSSK